MYLCLKMDWLVALYIFKSRINFISKFINLIKHSNMVSVETKNTLKSTLGNDYETGHLDQLPETSFLSEIQSGAFTNFSCLNGGSPGTAECEDKDGMILGQHVSINNSTEIQKWVYRSDDGKVFDIYLGPNSSGGVYRYQFLVEAQGPDTGWWSTAGLKIHFTDMTGDEYSLDIISTTRKVHYLRYKSDRPNLKSFRWENS